MAKRLFDFLASFIGLVLLSPMFILISLLVKIGSKGPVFYYQSRVGRFNKDFRLIKFRSMRPDSDKKGLLTVGNSDQRITKIGYYLRKYKLDELPQLFNVLMGDMSLVGPRPEVRKYVDVYSEKQLKVLSVRPGITDLASIRYSDENALLARQTNPEQFYIDTVLPEKLRLNLEYVENNNFINDIKIILWTMKKVWK